MAIREVVARNTSGMNIGVETKAITMTMNV